mmetsp:Transcript_24392/g.52595  ORF Transcript_24392/g.52595 Transcript_24392/m.52595 type:complete len:80 (-) Transcript_24392:148-387(-)
MWDWQCWFTFTTCIGEISQNDTVLCKLRLALETNRQRECYHCKRLNDFESDYLHLLHIIGMAFDHFIKMVAERKTEQSQ